MAKVNSETNYRERISDLVTEAYRECGITVEPLHPYVVVKVLPRAGQTASGLLYLPQKQNKILIEGVVLATYKSFWRTYQKETVRDPKHIGGRTMEEITNVEITPSVLVGDHVIWQHYEGAPVTPLTDDYRLVREDVLQGRLDYQNAEEFMEWMAKVLSEGGRAGLLAKAYVIRKDMPSLTTSGL